MKSIPIGQSKPTCPKCGAQLQIEHSGDNLKGNERILCPVHGYIGSLNKIRTHVLEENRDKIIEDAKQRVRDALRGSFKPR